MAMDSLSLHEALLTDPISSRVLEEHGISPSVLQFVDFEIRQQKAAITLANTDGKIKVGVKASLDFEDPGELAHMLAHELQDNLATKAELFAYDNTLVQKLDAEFLRTPFVTQERYSAYKPLYEAAFVEPKAGSAYLDRLFKTAQTTPRTTNKLHQLAFNAEEKSILNMLRKAALHKKVRLYVVGGCVRDKLLGEENHDLDFMVVTDDIDGFVQYFANTNNLREPVKLERSQAYTLRIDGTDVDIIDARRVYVPMNRGDIDSLEEEDDWSLALDDIFRRDLTINAIIYDVVGNKVLDPTKRGFQHLQQGIVETIIDPYVKYRINAFDMIRALRFAAVYDFKLGNDMAAAMKTNANRIIPRNLGGDISNRRILRELRKAAETADSWYRMQKLLAEVGLTDNLIEDIEKVEVQRTTLSEGKEDE